MSAKHDCATRVTISKNLRPERPECAHGPMRNHGKAWICRKQGQALKTKYRSTKKGRMALRNERINVWQKNNEARIEANEAQLSTLLGAMLTGSTPEGDTHPLEGPHRDTPA